MTELDDGLRRLTAERRGERAIAARLTVLIDQRLEQRHAFTTGPLAAGDAS